MPDPVSLLIFAGGTQASDVEEMLTSVHQAITLDTIEKALSINRRVDLFDRIILLTDNPALATAAGAYPILVEMSSSSFHFGQELARLIHRFHIHRPLYIGGGSAPLLTAAALEQIATTLSQSENALIANNVFSMDFMGFTPGAAIDRISPPAIDNNLAWLLKHQAGLQELPLARTAATQLDVDTPSDILILKVCRGVGQHTRAALDRIHLDTSRLRQIMTLLVDPDVDLILAGRVGSAVWAYLENETACRLRVFSEERGMRAAGREAAGTVRSFLGYYLQEVGATRFFATLAQIGQGALIDSRVIFHHLHLNLPAPDRFYSDLGQWQKIVNPVAREFTRAAVEAPLPVVLGGHTLVAGGLWALIDTAWAENDEKLELANSKQ